MHYFLCSIKYKRRNVLVAVLLLLTKTMKKTQKQLLTEIKYTVNTR